MRSSIKFCTFALFLFFFSPSVSQRPHPPLELLAGENQLAFWDGTQLYVQECTKLFCSVHTNHVCVNRSRFSIRVTVKRKAREKKKKRNSYHWVNFPVHEPLREIVKKDNVISRHEPFAMPHFVHAWPNSTLIISCTEFVRT